jgi:hypothetical protein
MQKETHKGKTARREATEKVGHISISFGFDSTTNEKKMQVKTLKTIMASANDQIIDDVFRNLPFFLQAMLMT